MRARAVGQFQKSAISSGAVILALLVLAASGGCAHRYYLASRLPDELKAQPAEPVDTTLLSRLAPTTVGSEAIEPGDLLSVTIDPGYGQQPARTTPVWVQEDGTAMVPLVGSVPLAGLTLMDAGRAIAAAGVERGMYVSPYPFVTVEMKQQRMNHVTVIGAVAEPGVKDLARGSSHLLAAIVAAGNLTETAGPEIEIIRGGARPGTAPLSGVRTATGPRAELTAHGGPAPHGPERIRVQLASLTEPGAGGYELYDKDVVVVHERQPGLIHVIGLVHKPDKIELPPGREVRVLDALAMAGGRTSELADKVNVIRKLPGQEDPVQIRVSVREAKRNGAANLVLAAGDVVSVEETPATFLVDLMRNFVRFGLSSTVPLF